MTTKVPFRCEALNCAFLNRQRGVAKVASVMPQHRVLHPTTQVIDATHISRRSALVAFVGMAAGAAPAADSPIIRIGRADYLSPMTDIEERVLVDAFGRIDLRCEFVRIPLLRLIEMADSGMVDGDVGRIRDVASNYQNLSMISTPICHADIAVYGRTRDFERRARQEILGMNVGIVRGVFLLSKYTHGMNVVEAPSFEAVMTMLSTGRIDAVMGVHLDAEVQIQNGTIPRLTRWPYLWASEPLYCSIHRSRATTIQKLEPVLKSMAEQGVIDRYYADATKSIGLAPLRPETAVQT